MINVLIIILFFIIAFVSIILGWFAAITVLEKEFLEHEKEIFKLGIEAGINRVYCKTVLTEESEKNEIAIDIIAKICHKLVDELE